MQDKQLKQKVLHEIRMFWIYAVFLTLFFCSLTTYHRLILGEYSISYFHYGSGIIQALIIAKVILVGESLHLGEKIGGKDTPLIFPTLYKAVIFSVFVLVFSIFEHLIEGYFHNKKAAAVYYELLNQGKDAILAKVLVVFFVFIIFFAFIETANMLGEGKLIDRFFSKKKD